MNKQVKLYLLDLMKILAKVRITNNEKEKLKEFFNDATYDDLNMLTIYRNRIEFLLAYHYFELRREEEFGNKILRTYIRAIDSQMGYLQYKYYEYLDEMSLVINILEKEQIRYVVLKGFSLIDELYKHNGVIYRNFTDCDILIERKDVGTVHKILMDLGYVQGTINKSNEVEIVNRNKLIYWSLTSHQEYPYIKKMKIQTNSPYKVVNIDINTSIFEGGKCRDMVNTSFLLEHRKRTSCGKLLLWRLTNEFQLVQLCYHFYKDMLYEIKKESHVDLCLIKFCDIREFITKNFNEIDWKYFLQIIEEHMITDKILFTMNIVVSFYGDDKLIKLVDKLSSDAGIQLAKYSNEYWEQLVGYN